MHFHYRNVNDAFRGLVGGIATMAKDGDAKLVRRQTRNGAVLMIDEPVMVTYERPRERVLFNTARDANPFFHLYEALWMLAGRNDVAPLVYYNKRMAEFSDGGTTFNGAYGYRWRHADTSVEERDQLDVLVEHLQHHPDSRRAVLQMWNVEDDLMYIHDSKDVCCNLSVLFSIRDGVLDMTVTNRSNDMIWGMLGANVVHFSFLQEYMAAQIGVEVGRYTQMTNNLHVYESNWKPEEWLSADQDTLYAHYKPSTVPTRFVKDPTTFDNELPQFVEQHKELGNIGEWKEPFFRDVADPMLVAFHWYKKRCYEAALAVLEKCQADDWRIAATNWILKRMEKHDRKR